MFSHPQHLMIRALTSALLLATATSAFPTAPIAAAKQKLEIWMFLSTGSTEGQAMTALAERFQQENPDVGVQITWGVTLDKLKVGVLGGQRPDIVQVQGDWVNSLALQGVLAPLDTFLRGASISYDLYWPPLLPQLELNGKSYGLPWTVNAHFALWWNPQALSEIGANPDRAPNTLIDLKALHKKLTRIGSDGKLARIGFTPWATGHMANALYFWGGYFGSKFYDPSTGRFHLNDAGGADAVEWMLDFATDFTAQESMQKPFWPITDSIPTGYAAMGPAVPPWVTNAVRSFPNVAFGVDVMPTMGPGRPRGDFLAGAVLALPSTVTEFNPIAWKFLEYATASAEGSRLQSGDFGLFPAYRRAPVIQAWLNDRHRGPFVRLAQLAARGRPPLSDQDFVTNTLNQFAGEALRREKPPRAALDEANRILQQHFDELKQR